MKKEYYAMNLDELRVELDNLEERKYELAIMEENGELTHQQAQNRYTRVSKKYNQVYKIIKQKEKNQFSDNMLKVLSGISLGEYKK
jgi:hypothetical protein